VWLLARGLIGEEPGLVLAEAPKPVVVFGLLLEPLVRVVACVLWLGLTEPHHLWVQRQQRILSVGPLVVVSLLEDALLLLREHVPFALVPLSVVPHVRGVPA